MAKYQITGPDGGSYEVEAPDDASEAQILDYVKSQSGTSIPHEAPQAKEGTGNVAALLEGAGQGLTFGFGDEIEGGARALYNKVTGDGRPISELYSEGVAKPRARIKEAADTNPWAFYTGEIGAGFAVPGGLAKLGVQGALARSAGKSLGARSVAAAKEGTAYGAAYGAGKSEGGPLNMLYDAGIGAGTGMAVGAAIPGAVDVLGSAANRLAAPFRSYMNPKGVAAEKFGEAVSRDIPDGVGGAPRFADRFQNMLATNPSARAMDAGGENVRSLMRAAGNMPNEGREGARRLLDARQGNQWVRIENELTSTLAPGRAFGETIDEIAAKRAKDATPAFERAYSAPFNVRPDDDLTKFIQERGYMRRLVEKADETISGMTGKSAPDSLTGKAPQASAAQVRPWEFLHRVKMEIDREIGRLKRGEQDSKASWTLRDLYGLKSEFQGLMEKQNPALGSAMKRYSDQSSLINAADDGFKDFLTTPVHELRKELAKLAPTDREMYRLGASRAIMDKIERGNITGDRTDSVFSSPDIQKRLAAIMPDRAMLRKFQKQMIVEAKMADSRKALQGNSTTAKQLTEGAEAGKTASMVTSAMNAASGRMAPALDLLAQGYNRFSGLTPGVANELLRLGLSQNPAMGNALARQSIEQASRIPAQRAAIGRSAIGAGASFATQPTEIYLTPDGRPQ